VLGFITGDAMDTSSIDATVTFMPISGGYPGFIKKFTTWDFAFSDASFEQCNVSFSTDWYPTEESVILVPKQFGGWGTLPWGTFPWGVGGALTQSIPTYSTKNTSICHWVNATLNLQQAFQGFALNGLTVTYEFYGTRSR
jgi:hypothetical protein